MNHDWSEHPLRVHVSKDGWYHAITQADGEAAIQLGSVRRDDKVKRFYFHPLAHLRYSNTQLWQILTYLTEQNDILAKQTTINRNPNDEL